MLGHFKKSASICPIKRPKWSAMTNAWPQFATLLVTLFTKVVCKNMSGNSNSYAEFSLVRFSSRFA